MQKKAICFKFFLNSFVYRNNEFTLNEIMGAFSLAFLIQFRIFFIKTGLFWIKLNWNWIKFNLGRLVCFFVRFDLALSLDYFRVVFKVNNNHNPSANKIFLKKFFFLSETKSVYFLGFVEISSLNNRSTPFTKKLHVLLKKIN